MPIKATRAEEGNRAKKRNEHDDHSGDEGGLRGRGKTQAGGLELIAHRQAETDDGAGREGPAIHASEVAAVEERQTGESEGHADEVEEQRGDIGESTLDDDKSGSPDRDHSHKKDVRPGGARS
jgi:hypothetical protein